MHHEAYSYPPPFTMSRPPSGSPPSFSRFQSALHVYKRRTGRDLPSHPLSSTLQSCDSPDAILAVLREEIPASGQSLHDLDSFSKWLVPTVNVIHAFSASLDEGVSLTLSPANIVFSGIGVLFSVAKDVSSSRDRLVDVFNRIGYFFRRLEIYTGVHPTAAMMDIIVEVMAEVLIILAMATEETKRGQLEKYVKKLIGNTEVEDAMQKLDRLTQEVARIASAERLKNSHGINGTLMRGNDRLRDVNERVRAINSDTQDVGRKVRDVYDRVQTHGVGDKIPGVHNELYHPVDRSSFFSPSCSSYLYS
ncbi:hypothetical protein F5148DRAFT_1226524 [Russula earlei]|uniref:Uncharacterized protein n=1 Tax=Russula earlei TaxID=71964 RepID=A0ACC0U1M3_9AGAM|nr:hypothetical protein F5148DRAFT_1226524 [Russula earlei]